MVYLATLILAIGLVAGLLGIYNVGINMALGFYLFWALAILGVAFLSLDQKRKKRFL